MGELTTLFALAVALINEAVGFLGNVSLHSFVPQPFALLHVLEPAPFSVLTERFLIRKAGNSVSARLMLEERFAYE